MSNFLGTDMVAQTRTFCCVSIAVLAIVIANFAQAASHIPISPGDIIFTELFNGWHKLNPTTGEISVIEDWNFPRESAADWKPLTTLTFDADGALLYDSSSWILRLDPRTGTRSYLEMAAFSLQVRGFVVEPTGDLMFAMGPKITRYSRDTQLISDITDRFIFPRAIAQDDNGRIYVTGAIEGVLEIDPANGSTTKVNDFRFDSIASVAIQSDHELIVHDGSRNVLYRIDSVTGDVQVFADELPNFVQDFAVDNSGDLWLTSPSGLYKYPSTGGSGKLVVGGTSFSPQVIAVVPANWTPPPVPEPTALTLLCFGSIGFLRRR